MRGAMTSKIAVFGATGKIGSTAAADLRRRGLDVRAVVRNATKEAALSLPANTGCELFVADLLDRDATARALESVDGALFICPPGATSDDVLGHAQRIIDATAEAIDAARPAQVVVISDYGAHVPSGTGVTLLFRALEERYRALSVPITFLRSAEHMQNWSRQARIARARGVLPSLHHPVTKTFPTVSAFDVGSVAAELLAREPAHRGVRVVHVEGPRRYCAVDVAQTFEHLLGRSVVAQALPRAEWASVLTGAGLSADYARLVTELQDTHNAGGIDVEPDGEVLRGPTELSDALTAYRF